MRLYREEGGQTLVITALCLTCFMGFMALAVDVGVLFNTRRKLQVAADAAATAAALQYLYYYDGSNQAAAKTSAISAGNAAGQANVGSASVSVAVNVNPDSPSSHTGCVGTSCFFEAIVSQQNPTIFYSTFFALWQGQNANPFTVGARAVAGTPNASNNCVYLTNPTGTALTVRGNWSINAPNCGVYINSNSDTVEADTGNASNSGIAATSVSVVGPLPNDVTIASSSSATVMQTLPVTIPYSSTPSPTIPGSCPAGGTLTGTVAAGCYSGTVTIGSATLSGLYIFTGDVTINGALTGTDVTLAIMNGTLDVKPGNSTFNLSAPTSGAYDGIVIYQPSSNASILKLQAGSATGNLTGFIYAPAAQLSMQDHGGSLNVGGLVVNNIDNGPAVLNITGYAPVSSQLKVVTLVE
jgi:Flp pilus assembly protein TadG